VKCIERSFETLTKAEDQTASNYTHTGIASGRAACLCVEAWGTSNYADFLGARSEAYQPGILYKWCNAFMRTYKLLIVRGFRLKF
jgi:hypothetical protein